MFQLHLLAVRFRLMLVYGNLMLCSYLLRSATLLWKGNVLTSISDSVDMGRGVVCLSATPHTYIPHYDKQPPPHTNTAIPADGTHPTGMGVLGMQVFHDF